MVIYLIKINFMNFFTFVKTNINLMNNKLMMNSK